MIELSENLASLWNTPRELEQAMEPSGLEAVDGRRFLLRMLAASRKVIDAGESAASSR